MIEEIDVMGISVHKFNKTSLVSYIIAAAKKYDKRVIMNYNLHALYLEDKIPEMKTALKNANVRYIDGMPLIWLSLLTGNRLNRSNRITSIDIIIKIMALCEKDGLKVYILGGSESVLGNFIGMIRKSYPGLLITGRNGYFNKSDNEAIINEINNFQCNILMIGMGMPKQELWIESNRSFLAPSVIWSLGAFMDYWAGAQRMPNRTLSALGFEGLIRLLSNPKRLWNRYIYEPPVILVKIIAKYYGRKITLFVRNLRGNL